jgi:SAM-dependent methyltransferase
MPSVNDNHAVWGQSYDWSAAGDEWSAAWGGTTSEWYSTVLPRIQAHLPAASILEIATGHGRWTEQLIPYCTQFVGVDLATSCIEACERRFADIAHARFVVNDGRSLPGVEDESVDFAFSFESLVHCDLGVLAAYGTELSRVLKPGGVAFLHHSNLGQHSRALRSSHGLGRLARSSEKLSTRLKSAQLIGWDHWRAPDVTADRTAEVFTAAGLRCLGQEVVNWGSRWTIDCFTRVGREPLAMAAAGRVVNHRFMDEVESSRLSTASRPTSV